MRLQGMSALEPDSIHIDFTLQSTSYETRSIHFDHVCTTNFTHCDCAQGLLVVHMIGCAFFNKSSRSVEMLFWLLPCLLLCLCGKKKTTKSHGTGTLDHKESRKEAEAASGTEKVAKVWIVVSINTCSVQDERWVRLFHTPRTAGHFLHPCSSKESNYHVIISFLAKIHFWSTSNPPTRDGLPGSRSNPRKSTHEKRAQVRTGLN